MENHDVLRSCRSQQISFVKFCNKSNHDVSLDWIDFNGQRQSYVNSKPGWQIPIKTYVGHPWMACRHKFRHAMVFSTNHDLVYFPEPSTMVDGIPTQHEVNILTPMHSLKMLCLQTLHKYIRNKSEVDKLHIPMPLKKHLKQLFDIQENMQLSIRIIELD